MLKLSGSGLFIKPLQIFIAVSLLLLNPLNAMVYANSSECSTDEVTASNETEAGAALVSEVTETVVDSPLGNNQSLAISDSQVAGDHKSISEPGTDAFVEDSDSNEIANEDESVFVCNNGDSDNTDIYRDDCWEMCEGNNDANDDPVVEPGNSYVAVVIPEDGTQVIADEPTRLTVTFSELGSTSLGSAQLSIPDSLSVDEAAGVDITEGWGYRWDDPEENSPFSRALSIWALLDTGYLGRNHSVSATFTAKAEADETHSFETKAWQNAAIDADNQGSGPGSAVNNMAEGYNNPKINVWVNSADDLNEVRDNLNWHYVQTADIDLNSYAEGQGWEPIGSGEASFIGSYNGSGYEVDKLTIDRGNKDCIGLFGKVGGSAVITDLSLTNINITGVQNVGALVGYLEKGIIMNSFAEGDLAASGLFAGGLVGRNDWGTVIDSQAAVNVTGKQYTGGLVGGNRLGGYVINCSAHGEVNGTTDVGGLVGSNSNRVENSHATGDVSSELIGIVTTGGLVGHNRDQGEIVNCHATGNVNTAGGGYVGGLVGHNAYASVFNSYASGSVTGFTLVGGLIGFNDFNGVLKSSFSLGNVTGNSVVGGLVGYNLSLVENCYAAGLAKGGSSFVGGLVGKNLASSKVKGTIINSYYAVESGGPADIYGEHLNTADMKEIASFTGWSMAETGDFDPDDVKEWYIFAGQAFPKLFWQYDILTIKAASHQKIYGSADPVFSFIYAGFRPGDNEQMLDGNLTANREPGESVGSYIVKSSGVTALCNSYLLVFEDELLAITPKTLVIKADSFKKEHGLFYKFEGSEYSSTGLVEGDQLYSVLLVSAGADESAAVGDYLISVSDALGVGLENYNILYLDGTLTVFKAGITKAPSFGTPAQSFPAYEYDCALPPKFNSILPLIFVPENLKHIQQPLITTAFIKEGTAEDLATAAVVYEKTRQQFEVNSYNLSARESAIVQVELAVTKAAVYALDYLLTAEKGLLDLIAEAYAEAVELFYEYKEFLTEEESMLVKDLLTAVERVLLNDGFIAEVTLTQ